MRWRMFLRAMALALAAGLGIGLSQGPRAERVAPNQMSPAETSEWRDIDQRSSRCVTLDDDNRGAIEPRPCATRSARPRLFKV